MTKLTSIMLILLTTLFVWADEDFEDPSTGDSGHNFARITYTDQGNSYLSQEGTFELDRNLAINAGSSLDTQPGGFAEVEFIDGSLVQIDGSTRVEFQAINDTYNDESVSVMNLLDGNLFLHITPSPEWLKQRVFRIDSVHGSIFLEAPGLYRIDKKSYQMKLYVYRGIGELAGEKDAELVRSGEYSAVSNLGYPFRSKPFNAFYKDRFAQWAYYREPHAAGVSAQYVAPEISRYSYSLDRAGTWRYYNDLGTHVWVPVVKNSWRPYYDGYWSNCGPSLSWVGHNEWSWVTGHYGRWGWDVSFGWYWMPDRFYAPAWVAWTVFDGLLGWCPLGRWNRPWYYDRHHAHNTVIINHFNNTWVYRSPDRIHVRGSNHYRAVPRGSHTIKNYTTRAVRVDRNTRSNPRAYTRSVLEPRSQSRQTVTRTSTRTTYQGRNANTRATSRYRKETSGRSFTRIDQSGRMTSTSSTRGEDRSQGATRSRTSSSRSNSDRVTTAPRRIQTDKGVEASRSRERSNTESNRNRESDTRSRTSTRSKPQTESRTDSRSNSRTETRSRSESSSRSSTRKENTERKPSSPKSTYRVPSRTKERKESSRSSSSTRSRSSRTETDKGAQSQRSSSSTKEQGSSTRSTQRPSYSRSSSYSPPKTSTAPSRTQTSSRPTYQPKPQSSRSSAPRASTSRSSSRSTPKSSASSSRSSSSTRSKRTR